MPSKPFTTVEEQIQLLKKRGVGFSDESEAARFLLGKGYYIVINGYKSAFLDEEMTNLASDDRYREGITFAHFKLLYTFDATLRSMVMNLLLDAESAMKTAVIYAFCEVHREIDAYLDPANYCSRSAYHDEKNYTRGLIKLLSTLQGIRDNRHRKEYIAHYDGCHHCVPLWVAGKCLTFGNVSAFFDFQQQAVKTRSCIALAKTLGKRTIKQRDLTYAFRTLPAFRNICAHNERLYCARTGKRGDKGFPELLRALSYVSTAESLSRFVSEIIELLNEIEKVAPDLVTEILSGMKMGYQDFESIEEEG